MIRSLAVFALVLAACREQETPDPASGNTAATGSRNATAVAPPTGISSVEARHRELAEEVARLEQDPRREERIVQGVVKAIDNLILVVEQSIRNDTRQMTQKRHGLLVTELGKAIARRGEMLAEAQRLDGMLAEGGSVPAGFTREEVEDQRNDCKAEAAKAEAREKEVRSELKVLEDLLAQETIEPTEETMATRELDALKALRAKAEALQAR